MIPHKHKDLIVAWSNGSEIEIYNPNNDEWYPTQHPSWVEENVYRIKLSGPNRKEIYNDLNHILDEFDFERVNDVMKSICWEWVMSDGRYGIPSIPELRKHARKLLEETVSGLISSNESDYCIECGGFRAEADKYENDKKIYIKLSFVVTSWENEY